MTPIARAATTIAAIAMGSMGGAVRGGSPMRWACEVTRPRRRSTGGVCQSGEEERPVRAEDGA